MATDFRRAVISCFLAICVPCSLMAGEVRGAMLHGQGDIRVNGQVTSNGTTAILSGDKIETGKSAAAVISSPKLQVQVGEDSALYYQGSELRLQEGRAIVTGGAVTSARLADVTVSSSSDSSQFKIAHTDGQFVIAALRGSVTVSDGSSNMLLEAGKMMTRADGQEPEAPAPKSKRKKAGLAAWQVGLITAVAAGATVGGLAAAGVFSGKSTPVSPSKPGTGGGWRQ